MHTLVGIVVALVVLTFLVVIHEAAHALVARACGMRVTELFVGLPFGPSVSVQSPRSGIRYGATLALLGGYTRISGMAGSPDERLPLALALVNARGRLTTDELARVLGCDDEEAGVLLDALADLGSIEPEGGARMGEASAFCTVARDPAGLTIHDRGHDLRAPGSTRAGEPYRGGLSPEALLEQDVAHTYAGKGFARRAAVLLAGIASNLLFAIAVVIVYLMVHGVAYEGATYYLTLSQALPVSLAYAADVAHAVVSLVIPTHTAEVLQQSAGVVGIVAISGEAASGGAWDVVSLAAALSLSLGWINLLPIPPMDGGKLAIELVQAVIRRPVPLRVQNAISVAGMAVLMLLFVVMVGLDVSRVASGFYSFS